MPRDAQRQRVYDAEDIFLAHNPQKILSLREAQDYVNEVRASPVWVANRRSAFIIRVRRNPYFRTTMGQSNNRGRVIELGNNGFIRMVILHEMTHSMITDHTGDKLADHGSEFMWFYRKLVQEQFSARLYVAWEKTMLLKGVRWERWTPV